ncbi:pyrroloquinoline quinone biosynthesis protein PqqF [Pseudomonas sp. BN102]|uniref:pyrroloquinoline quinone biosynthesis protein PqqF n=1 Tax=Pseudomonas sp. BN102 TaxID=2567886 RepID=UPI00245449E2|nr:pyrroloquinoline quinone biosynthesis protein PqqF [Pseudomonas sp. BN102]
MSTLVEAAEPQLSLDFRLANGLRVRLVRQPCASLAAALVEVGGGSHDEPAEYPGLAHFLEHLVFLGSRDFPDGEGLIPFVQDLGGRVNASTRPHSTRFFCEVPAQRLDDALARLLDMLANPLLEPDALKRERDVLEAEYSARARDPQTLCEAALAWALAPGHPLADFHAGNAASLKLEEADFFPALRGFHQAHYQPGRMRLTLVAPQSLAELMDLARRLGGRLPAGRALPEPAVRPMLPLRAGRLRLGLPSGRARLLLAFALEGQVGGAESALGYLQSLMTDESADGLLARLFALDLSDAVQLRLPYVYGGQGLLLMDFDLVTGADCALLEAELLDWLAFLRAASPWPGTWEERLEIMRRKAALQAPLEAALAAPAPTQADVRALLEQLLPERLIRLETGESTAAPTLQASGFPLCLERLEVPPAASATGDWCLPAANPYLRPTVPGVMAISPVPLLPGLASAPGQAALFLRWKPGQMGLPRGLAHGLQRALRPMLGAAAQAGLEGRIQTEQGCLALTLQGNAALLSRVAGDLLPALQVPSLRALAQGERLQQEELRRLAGELPIRQLLQCLPERLDGPHTETPAVLAPEALARFWWQARWQGLGVGELALGAELPGLPGSVMAPAGKGGRVWRQLEMPGSEAALLLFYPLAHPTPEEEACWRLLACGLERAFHQRLRGELQVGYALACGFRQLGPHRGLLFAVQSPRSPVASLLEHMQDFLARQYASLARLDQGRLQALVGGLDLQLQRQAASFTDHARQCWLDRLAGLPPGHAGRVRQALGTLQPVHLLEQQGRLIAGLSCHALANAAAPSPDWHISA